ncbi:MAG: hypothetical protein FWC26_05110 [Fibromonadales bacterium]|nr:hypothetical protein [Fibromonadales bacterium]
MRNKLPILAAILVIAISFPYSCSKGDIDAADLVACGAFDTNTLACDRESGNTYPSNMVNGECGVLDINTHYCESETKTKCSKNIVPEDCRACGDFPANYKCSRDEKLAYPNNGITIEDFKKCGEFDPATYFCDKRGEGRKYKYVMLGNGDIWMAENLNYKPSAWTSVCYGFKEENCEDYGRLYAPQEGLFREEICPDGWKIPGPSYWDGLVSYVGGKVQNYEDEAEIHLKSNSDNWDTYRQFEGKNLRMDADNSSGFNAMPYGAYKITYLTDSILANYMVNNEYKDNIDTLIKYTDYLPNAIIINYLPDYMKKDTTMTPDAKATFFRSTFANNNVLVNKIINDELVKNKSFVDSIYNKGIAFYKKDFSVICKEKYSCKDENDVEISDCDPENPYDWGGVDIIGKIAVFMVDGMLDGLPEAPYAMVHDPKMRFCMPSNVHSSVRCVKKR